MFVHCLILTRAVEFLDDDDPSDNYDKPDMKEIERRRKQIYKPADDEMSFPMFALLSDRFDDCSNCVTISEM